MWYTKSGIEKKAQTQHRPLNSHRNEQHHTTERGGVAIINFGGHF